MGKAAVKSLRDRLAPPSRPCASVDAPGQAKAERVLRLAVELLSAESAALVAVRPEGLVVEAWTPGLDADDATVIDTARQLVDALAPAPTGHGVLEDVAPRRGLRAAAPLMSAEGRCVGALCIVDRRRTALLTRLQRRLLAELGDLASVWLDRAGAGAAADAFGGNEDLRRVFHQCPYAMFVADRESRSILAANDAARVLYGWEHDDCRRLTLDDVGPVGSEQVGERSGAMQTWIHRTSTGGEIAVAGQAVGLQLRGRAAVLVTVTQRAGSARASGDRAA